MVAGIHVRIKEGKHLHTRRLSLATWAVWRSLRGSSCERRRKGQPYHPFPGSRMRCSFCHPLLAHVGSFKGFDFFVQVLEEDRGKAVQDRPQLLRPVLALYPIALVDVCHVSVESLVYLLVCSIRLLRVVVRCSCQFPKPDVLYGSRLRVARHTHVASDAPRSLP